MRPGGESDLTQLNCHRQFICCCGAGLCRKNQLSLWSSSPGRLISWNCWVSERGTFRAKRNHSGGRRRTKRGVAVVGNSCGVVRSDVFFGSQMPTELCVGHQYECNGRGTQSAADLGRRPHQVNTILPQLVKPQKKNNDFPWTWIVLMFLFSCFSFLFFSDSLVMHGFLINGAYTCCSSGKGKQREKKII